MPITTTTLQTTIPIKPEELEAVKKALAAWLKQHDFVQHGYIHNHENDDDPGFEKQDYPLIQFRCKNKQLLLWGMQQGAAVLQQIMLQQLLLHFQFKGSRFAIVRPATETSMHEMGIAEDAETHWLYELNYFIAFTPENFKHWQQLPTAALRMERLQELLINNITMFCKAVGYGIDKTLIKADIYWVWHTRWVLIKGHKVLAFTLSYSSNVLLPDGIALGRQTRLGYGWQTKRGE